MILEGDFFAMVLERNKDGDYLETTFNQDLQMGKDSVMTFPSSFGVSGDVHLNIGYKYDSDFGNLAKLETESDKGKTESDIETIQKSQYTSSSANFKKRGAKKTFTSAGLEIIEEQQNAHGSNALFASNIHSGKIAKVNQSVNSAS